MKITDFGRWYILSFHDFYYDPKLYYFKTLPTTKLIRQLRPNNSYYSYQVHFIDNGKHDRYLGYPKEKYVKSGYFDGPIHADPARINSAHYLYEALSTINRYSCGDKNLFWAFAQSYFQMSIDSLMGHLKKLNPTNTIATPLNYEQIIPRQMIFAGKGKTVVQK